MRELSALIEQKKAEEAAKKAAKEAAKRKEEAEAKRKAEAFERIVKQNEVSVTTIQRILYLLQQNIKNYEKFRMAKRVFRTQTSRN